MKTHNIERHNFELALLVANRLTFKWYSVNDKFQISVYSDASYTNLEFEEILKNSLTLSAPGSKDVSLNGEPYWNDNLNLDDFDF